MLLSYDQYRMALETIHAHPAVRVTVDLYLRGEINEPPHEMRTLATLYRADTAKAATEAMCLELVNILAIQPELAGKANALAVGIQEATK